MRSRGITLISLKNVVCGGDTRKLFQVVQSLSNKPEENQLPPHDDPCKLADDFGEFFCRKVDLIRNDIDAITVVSPILMFLHLRTSLRSLMFSPRKKCLILLWALLMLVVS